MLVVVRCLSFFCLGFCSKKCFLGGLLFLSCPLLGVCCVCCSLMLLLLSLAVVRCALCVVCCWLCLCRFLCVDVCRVLRCCVLSVFV